MGENNGNIDVRDLLFRTPLSSICRYFSSTGLSYVNGMWKGKDEKIIKKKNRYWPHTVGVSNFQKSFTELIVTFYFVGFEIEVRILKELGNVIRIKKKKRNKSPVYIDVGVLDQYKTLGDYIVDDNTRVS